MGFAFSFLDIIACLIAKPFTYRDYESSPLAAIIPLTTVKRWSPKKRALKDIARVMKKKDTKGSPWSEVTMLIFLSYKYERNPCNSEFFLLNHREQGG